MWLITNAKNGISSYEIHRALGITQKSAWFLLHRIRLAMQRGSFAKFCGTIEADETYIGGKARNMHKTKREAVIKGRGGVGKAIVMGVLERGRKGNASQVVATVIPDTKKETLQTKIQDTVRKGSRVNTDTNASYVGLSAEYVHESVCHDAEEYVRGQVWTNGMENFWSLLKRTIKGTYVSCEPFHLFRYLDEQTFRYNERKANDLGRFMKVVSSVADRRLT